MADYAKIDVDLTDLRFASEGDEIEFEGWSFVTQKEQVHATKVWVTITRPLGEASAQQTAKKNTSAAEGDASDEQRTAARNIQTALARAKKGYDSGNYHEAGGIIVSIIEQWDGLVKSDKAVAARLLQPHHKPLKLVHAFLEVEGCTLPELPELPEIEGVAAR